ncbi:hypothetical protein Q9233_007550 [Columba guinea]|nr:hypothetical protein Q9233_007550 [Columba guinea]
MGTSAKLCYSKNCLSIQRFWGISGTFIKSIDMGSDEVFSVILYAMVLGTLNGLLGITHV